MIFMINKQIGEDFGELLISGPQLFSSYFKKEKLYRQKIFNFQNKLFYKTGDIVKKINGNYYFFQGRIDKLKRVAIGSNLKKLTQI